MRSDAGQVGQLWAVILTVFFGTLAVNTAKFVTAYRIVGLGMGGDVVGAVSASFALLPLLFVLRIGRVTDRGRALLVVVSGLLIMGVGAAALGFSKSVIALIAANAIIGLGHVALVNASEASIARLKADSDYSFGMLMASYSLSQAAGPLLGGVLLTTRGADDLVGATSLALTICAVVTLVAMAPMLVARMWDSPVAARPRAERTRLLPIVREPRVAASLFVSMTTVTYIEFATVYFPLLGEVHGWSPAVVGALLAARAVSSFVARLFTQRTAGAIGRPQLMALSAAVPGLLLVALTGFDSVVFAFAAVVISGVLLGFGQPLAISSLTRMAPADAVGLVLAARLAGNRLALVLIPALAGAVAGILGVMPALWLMAAMLVWSAVVVLLHPPRLP
jgi:MFS family permease